MIPVILVLLFLVTILYTYLVQLYLGLSIITLGYLLLMALLMIGLYLTITITKNREQDKLLSMIHGKTDIDIYDEGDVGTVKYALYQLVKRNELLTQQAKKDREQIASLVSDISHQSKTPLSNIILYTELCMQQANTVKNNLTAIKEQAQKLQFLFNALNKLSRCECGLIEQNITCSLHSIKELLTNALNGICLLAEQKNIEIEIKPMGNDQAWFDLRWTAEAVTAVLDNAVKYTKEHGSIDIWTEQREFYSCIMIRDTGIGIRKEELPRIFGRFYRGKNASAEGVGIGLYLATEILQVQHGYITVKSKEQQGSLFQIYLPRTNQAMILKSDEKILNSDESVSFSSADS